MENYHTVTISEELSTNHKMKYNRNDTTTINAKQDYQYKQETKKDDQKFPSTENETQSKPKCSWKTNLNKDIRQKRKGSISRF